MAVKIHHLALVAAMALVCALVAFGTVRYTGHDPHGELLLSDSLVFHQSFKLDAYAPAELDSYGVMVHRKNGHPYYFFPIGTSLASMPVVALAKPLGYNYAEHDQQLQIFLACITALLTVLYLARLASLVLAPFNGLLLASLFWLGTAFASTGGTALWSHNFATLFALMAIFYAVRPVLKNREIPWPLIGSLLFLAYLCRPTMALLSPCLLLFLFAYHKKAAIQAGMVLALLLAGFVAWSFSEFNQPLPDYYLPKRLVGGSFGDAFVGNLISPARGLLVYSPFIVLVWLYHLVDRREQQPLKLWWLLIGLVWPLLHLLFVSRFPHWWAGWSYGSRFMMDCLPGLFLLTVMAWPRSMGEIKSAPAITAIVALGVGFSIFINTCQGLYNPYSKSWNGEPNIDEFSGYLFDWRYPPFLHNAERSQRRLAEHNAQLDFSRAVVVIHHNSEDGVVLKGWSFDRPAHRWNDGNVAAIDFLLPESPKPVGVIKIVAMYYGNQRVNVSLNGEAVASYSSREVRVAKTIAVKPNQLLPGQWNSLVFDLPDAKSPGEQDPRLLAMGLKIIAIE